MADKNPGLQNVPTRCTSDGEVDDPVQMREIRRRQMRHAVSEWFQRSIESDTPSDSLATTGAEVAINHLRKKLSSAHAELKLKDEECEKLLKVREQIGEELSELTASLFEEANKMVIDANVKRIHAEKLLGEASQQIEVLQAEVSALKQLVLTSTPSSPNRYLSPHTGNGESKDKDKKNDKEKSLPFWRTHHRTSSHHQFTQEDRIKAEEANSDPITDRCKELDDVCFEEFGIWRQNVTLSRDCPFIAKIFVEDITTCLNFTNTQHTSNAERVILTHGQPRFSISSAHAYALERILQRRLMGEKVLRCVENNSLAIEPISGEVPYVGKCQLSEVQKTCNYKVKLGDETDWYCISQHCRNRIAAVCDFFTYVRYITQGLVKSDDKDIFYEIVRLRKYMALARLGYV